jgi:UDP-N-acetylmuramoyl-tripeptide--D-alanyl-D-alanine ligase
MKAKFHVKAWLRGLVLEALRALARYELKRIHPRIVGVTGSAGKTSGKEAIFEVLARRLEVRKSEKNLNTEFGTVLSVLGQKSGCAGILGWIRTLWRGTLKVLRKVDMYDTIVLEMGVDKPGDMDEILQVIRPDVMVFFNVKGEHLDEGQFANKQAIFEEKSKAVYAASPDGWAVLNMDDNFVKQLDGKLPANVVKIGTGEECDLRAQNIESGVDGLKFVLAYEGRELPVHMPHILGACHVTIALAAIAVGFICGLKWSVIEHGLKEFRLPAGRMNRIPGKNGSLLIDSSYNASPDSTEAALEVLEFFGGPGSVGPAGPEAGRPRKIAALGTMNELGELTETAHLKIGKLAARIADVLITVGKYGAVLAEGANREGMPAEMIHVFKTSREAGAFLEGMLERNDVVLVKGSQNNVRMEHLVKACMQEPEKARQLLVRQEPYWLTKL